MINYVAYRKFVTLKNGKRVMFRFLNEQDVEAYKISNAGEYSGIGALVRSYDDRLVIVATGSEVSHALNAADKLAEDGVQAQVVSMPCLE